MSTSSLFDHQQYLLPQERGVLWRRALNTFGGIQPAPSALRGHTLTAASSGIFVFGGFDGDYREDLFFTTSEAEPWVKVVTSGVRPAARANHAAVWHGGKLWVFGGDCGFKDFNDLWVFDPEQGEWSLVETFGTTPPPLHGCSGTVVGECLVIFGGCGKQRGVEMLYDDTYVLDLVNLRWSLAPRFPGAHDDAGEMPQGSSVIPCARYRHALSSVNGHVYLYGGIDARGSVLDDMWELTPTRNTLWTQVRQVCPGGPGPLADHCVASSEQGTSFLIFGGITSPELTLSNTLWEFNTLTNTFSQWGVDLDETKLKAPEAREGSAMAFINPKTVMLIGGSAGGIPFCDMWIAQILETVSLSALPAVQKRENERDNQDNQQVTEVSEDTIVSEIKSLEDLVASQLRIIESSVKMEVDLHKDYKKLTADDVGKTRDILTKASAHMTECQATSANITEHIRARTDNVVSSARERAIKCDSEMYNLNRQVGEHMSHTQEVAEHCLSLEGIFSALNDLSSSLFGRLDIFERELDSAGAGLETASEKIGYLTDYISTEEQRLSGIINPLRAQNSQLSEEERAIELQRENEKNNIDQLIRDARKDAKDAFEGIESMEIPSLELMIKDVRTVFEGEGTYPDKILKISEDIESSKSCLEELKQNVIETGIGEEIDLIETVHSELIDRLESAAAGFDESETQLQELKDRC